MLKSMDVKCHICIIDLHMNGLILRHYCNVFIELRKRHIEINFQLAVISLLSTENYDLIIENVHRREIVYSNLYFLISKLCNL